MLAIFKNILAVFFLAAALLAVLALFAPTGSHDLVALVIAKMFFMVLAAGFLAIALQLLGKMARLTRFFGTLVHNTKNILAPALNTVSNWLRIARADAFEERPIVKIEQTEGAKRVVVAGWIVSVVGLLLCAAGLTLPFLAGFALVFAMMFFALTAGGGDDDFYRSLQHAAASTPHVPVAGIVILAVGVTMAVSPFIYSRLRGKTL